MKVNKKKQKLPFESKNIWIVNKLFNKYFFSK